MKSTRIHERLQEGKSESEPLDYDHENQYIGIEWSNKSNKKVNHHIEPHHDIAHSQHHTTLHPPGEELPKNHPLRDHIGKEVTGHVTHTAKDDDIQAARVKLPKGIDQAHNRDHPHITISRGKKIPAQRSNNMLQNTQGERLSRHIPITGRVRVFNTLGK